MSADIPMKESRSGNRITYHQCAHNRQVYYPVIKARFYVLTDIGFHNPIELAQPVLRMGGGLWGWAPLALSKGTEQFWEA